MDFIVGLPRTQVGYDSTWVIMDRLSKVAHFIPIKTTYSRTKLTELYMSQIVCLHGVPKKIVSDRGSSHPNFGRSFLNRWAPCSILAQHTIHRQMIQKELGWPDLSIRGDKFNLNWRDILGPTTTLQGCALMTDTPTPAVVHDLVEHNQPNR
jgi:hypothetical protein